MDDAAQIQMVINQFTESCSRRDWPTMLATYIPDGVWEVPAMNIRVVGHEALQSTLEAFAVPMEYILQMNAPAVIVVGDGVATARSVMRENGKYKDLNEVLEVTGFYADEFVKTAKGWRFSKRSFEVVGMHRSALLPLVPNA